MTKRPDQKNLDRLLAHGKDRVRYGVSLVRITWVDGWISGYVVDKIEEGSKAPLEFKPKITDD